MVFAFKVQDRGKHNYEDSITKKKQFFHTIQLVFILLKLFCGFRLDC
jgi:hypothetical protein